MEGRERGGSGSALKEADSIRLMRWRTRTPVTVKCWVRRRPVRGNVQRVTLNVQQPTPIRPSTLHVVRSIFDVGRFQPLLAYPTPRSSDLAPSPLIPLPSRCIPKGDGRAGEGWVEFCIEGGGLNPSYAVADANACYCKMLGPEEARARKRSTCHFERPTANSYPSFYVARCTFYL